MAGVKVSVSLPDADVEYLDEYATMHQLGSRSAALQRAVRLLRASELGAAYEAAWVEWVQAGEDSVWSVTHGDGLENATR